MAWDYTHVELLAGIKLRASIPTGAGSWTDANLLGEADRQIRSVIYPDILSVNAKLYAAVEDASIVANQATYRIPKRAFNSVVYEVNLLDASGNESDTAQVSLEDIPRYAANSYNPTNENVYAIDGALIRLLPTPTVAVGQVRVRYMRRPNQLVSTGYETISTVTSTTSFNVNAASLGDVSCDVISATNPFQSLSDSNSSTVTSTTRTFGTAITHAAVGDYICAVGETPVPQVPEQAHDVLEQAVAVKVLESMRAHAALSEAKAMLEQMRAEFRSAITPRVTEDPVRTVYHSSPLRVARSYF